MAKLLQEATFLLHHSPPTQPPNNEMLQTVFKGSFSLCQLLLSQQEKEEGQCYAISRRMGHKMGTSLKLKHDAVS